MDGSGHNTAASNTVYRNISDEIRWLRIKWKLEEINVTMMKWQREAERERQIRDSAREARMKARMEAQEARTKAKQARMEAKYVLPVVVNEKVVSVESVISPPKVGEASTDSVAEDEYFDFELIPSYFFEERDLSAVVDIPPYFFGEIENSKNPNPPEGKPIYDLGCSIGVRNSKMEMVKLVWSRIKLLGKVHSLPNFDLNRKVFDRGREFKLSQGHPGLTIDSIPWYLHFDCMKLWDKIDEGNPFVKMSDRDTVLLHGKCSESFQIDIVCFLDGYLLFDRGKWLGVSILSGHYNEKIAYKLVVSEAYKFKLWFEDWSVLVLKFFGACANGMSSNKLLVEVAQQDNITLGISLLQWIRRDEIEFASQLFNLLTEMWRAAIFLLQRNEWLENEVWVLHCRTSSICYVQLLTASMSTAEFYTQMTTVWNSHGSFVRLQSCCLEVLLPSSQCYFRILPLSLFLCSSVPSSAAYGRLKNSRKVQHLELRDVLHIHLESHQTNPMGCGGDEWSFSWIKVTSKSMMRLAGSWRCESVVPIETTVGKQFMAMFKCQEEMASTAALVLPAGNNITNNTLNFSGGEGVKGGDVQLILVLMRQGRRHRWEEEIFFYSSRMVCLMLHTTKGTVMCYLELLFIDCCNFLMLGVFVMLVMIGVLAG